MRTFLYYAMQETRGQRLGILLYLSFLAINYDLPVINEVQEWFESCVVLNMGNSMPNYSILLSHDGSIEQSVVSMLNNIGIDLSGYRYDEEQQRFFTQRTINGKVFELSYTDESDGTKN